MSNIVLITFILGLIAPINVFACAKEIVLSDAEVKQILVDSNFDDINLGSRFGSIRVRDMSVAGCDLIRKFTGVPPDKKRLELSLYSAPVRTTNGICIVISYYFYGEYEPGDNVSILADQKLAKIDDNCSVVTHKNYQGYVSVDPLTSDDELIFEIQEKDKKQKKIF